MLFVPRRRTTFLFLLHSSALLAGCGGGKSAGPTAPTVATAPAVPTALSVVSAETGVGISGAASVIAGQSGRTDAQGQVAVPGGAGAGVFVDLIAPGFLDRQTNLRAGGSSARLSLWPRTSGTGLDENFTAVLVYTSTADGSTIGALPLRRHRAGITMVSIVLADSLLADPAAMANHQFAADVLTAAVAGKVAYRVTPQAAAGSTIVNVSYEPGNAGCDDRTRAFTTIRLSGGEITSGTIVYCVPDAPRSPTVIHELGHTFGLLHSPNRTDLMYSTFVSDRSDVLTPRETLAMRLMLERSGGTRFPDNDRDTSGVTSSEANGVQTIRCR
ncbi:MAG: hypothetical protein ABI672_08400 [Vicinamibacteria bacterium]